METIEISPIQQKIDDVLLQIENIHKKIMQSGSVLSGLEYPSTEIDLMAYNKLGVYRMSLHKRKGELQDSLSKLFIERSLYNLHEFKYDL